MELRSLPSLLLSTLSPLFYLINLCNSVAPADLPPGCPTVSTIQRALLDSCCYSTLLPDRWNSSDEDADGRTVSETSTYMYRICENFVKSSYCTMIDSFFRTDFKYFITINREYFVVKIFSDNLAYVKIKLILLKNAVQCHLSENYRIKYS